MSNFVKKITTLVLFVCLIVAGLSALIKYRYDIFGGLTDFNGMLNTAITHFEDLQEENERLQNELTLSQSSVSDLQSEVSAFVEYCATIEEENNTLTMQALELNAQKTELSVNLSSLQNDFDSLSEQLETLSSDNASLVEDISSLQSSIYTYLSDISFLQNELSVAQNDLLISNQSLNGLVNGTITSFVFPENSVVRPYMFYGFENLVSVVLPDNIDNIPTCAFQYCTNLVNINVNNIRIFNAYCFQNCSSLTVLNLNPAIISFGQYCFGGCTALVGDFVITNSVCTVDKWAFTGTNINSVSFTGRTYINSYAFKDCLNLELISLYDCQQFSYNSTTGTSAKVVFVRGLYFHLNGVKNTVLSLPYATNFDGSYLVYLSNVLLPDTLNVVYQSELFYSDELGCLCLRYADINSAPISFENYFNDYSLYEFSVLEDFLQTFTYSDFVNAFGSVADNTYLNFYFRKI